MEWFLLLAAFLIAFALYLLFFLDRNIGDGGASISLIIAALCFAGGYYLVKKMPSAHSILWGIIWIFIGYLLIFKFPDYTKTQKTGFAYLAVFAGIILLIYGILLII
ncbi:MAG: hypothetical protein DRN66_00630 [Candidatus Nanohalarchaeota archaeon]|nr:MAG: hypothetical protein DRN66_00630 [Candidatus Nanohaloarchaeota archaeon]